MLVHQDTVSPHDFELMPIIVRSGTIYKLDPITERADKWSARHIPEKLLSAFGYYILDPEHTDIVIGAVMHEGMTIGGPAFHEEEVVERGFGE